MKAKNNLSYDVVSRLIRYDPDSGFLYWLERDSEFFISDLYWKAWNTRRKGKEALTAVKDNGYRQGTIFGSHYYAHRICWLLYYGEWPINEIDHIDHNRANNKIENLRDVTRRDNQKKYRQKQKEQKWVHRSTFRSFV